MYTEKNFKSKKELKDAIAKYHASGETHAPLQALAVRIFAPGLGKTVENGTESVCGPHYPAPHKWYASVTVKDGIVIKVK
jgi:hypothetical protein